MTHANKASRMRPMLERRYRKYTLHKPDVRSDYVDSSNDDAFQISIITAVKEKAPKPLVAIDMSEITHMSSAGHRVLLMAAKEAAKTKGKIILANVNDHIWERMELSGFTTIFRRTTLRPIRTRR